MSYWDTPEQKARSLQDEIDDMRDRQQRERDQIDRDRQEERKERRQAALDSQTRANGWDEAFSKGIRRAENEAQDEVRFNVEVEDTEWSHLATSDYFIKLVKRRKKSNKIY